MLVRSMQADRKSFDPEAIVRSFPKYEGPGQPGFITDFLGTRTRTRFLRLLANADGSVEDYPTSGNFHASPLEWAGTLQAALDADRELVAVELGAGWAPWLVALAQAARSRGIERTRLVGVEANAEHCEFMRLHFADNRIEPDEHTLLHGAVGLKDGVAEFPILSDPAVDFGARAHLTASLNSKLKAFVRQPLSAWRGTEKVKCYSLSTLLDPLRRVDIVHFDIQGDEGDVICSNLDLLRDKVARMVIGTHSTEVEQRLRQMLQAQGWLLEAEELAQFGRSRLRKYLKLDGCQVWKNMAHLN